MNIICFFALPQIQDPWEPKFVIFPPSIKSRAITGIEQALFIDEYIQYIIICILVLCRQTFLRLACELFKGKVGFTVNPLLQSIYRSILDSVNVWHV